jgi:hypothetical protein
MNQTERLYRIDYPLKAQGCVSFQALAGSLACHRGCLIPVHSRIGSGRPGSKSQRSCA